MKAAVQVSRLLNSLVKDRIDLSRCVQVRSSEVVPPQAPQAPQGLVLTAGVLLYRWIDVGSVPKPRRRAAVAALARAWTPFQESGFRVAWYGDSAGVFAWDAQRLRQRLSDGGLVAVKDLPVIPEPWLGSPVVSEPRLVQGLDGICGQLWQDGSLRALRWWSEAPDESQWLNFLRGAGRASVAAPTIEQRSHLEQGAQPEGIAPLLTLDDLQSRATGWDTVAAAIGSLALMAWTASLAHDEVQLRSRLATAEATLQQLEVRSKPVVALRDAALQDAQRAHALAALVTGPQALLVIEHLLTRLPALPGLLIRQLELNGRQVRLALEVPQGIERATIVTALEEGRWLTDVREARESGGNQLVLSMVLSGDRSPPVGSNPPGQPPESAQSPITAPPPAMGQPPASVQPIPALPQPPTRPQPSSFGLPSAAGQPAAPALPQLPSRAQQPASGQPPSLGQSPAPTPPPALTQPQVPAQPPVMLPGTPSGAPPGAPFTPPSR